MTNVRMVVEQGVILFMCMLLSQVRMNILTVITIFETVILSKLAIEYRN